MQLKFSATFTFSWCVEGPTSHGRCGLQPGGGDEGQGGKMMTFTRIICSVHFMQLRHKTFPLGAKHAAL